MGKEAEPKTEAERLAAIEVEGYIERIERQAETKPSVAGTPSPQPTAGATPADDAAKKAMSMAPQLQKQTIILPLDEDGVRRGLHHKIVDGIRWLAEWSLYMIKKYPGRVFYRPKTT
ncbi:hypothetical protein A3A84_00525 [Candidatus Collierbacteria bacterium RIFCSPLOWO2_01_FULL_50_23]|uniref:Uncharacterized protein n=2 Tax=Candidatus Collieribacteriota TaxID=1752725 RepID=A0A1F5EW15_9BACT|nr:MAG: hypothetical protein A2703_00600 [Candidatus Collierbacteria bacterium RIFCSPHIGHO2_01_FULL_50_25]OGD71601.1 MAG: hypothetical protein A3D09_02850 [Candidatus Collierbacteria bacterium RIFCSPHIGHO2_02_FULL_49_10]OGD73882.1 MAG: hypothetical protein A3A84_00525 [Candidatus Collierbacteria bacterium RIFCSPLOWO2_01_FULL_50_23]